MSAAKYEVGQNVCVHFKWDTFTIPDNEGMIQGVIQSAAKTIVVNKRMTAKGVRK